MTIPELMQIQDLLGRYAQELAHRGRVTSWATCADIASQARNDAEPGRAEFCDHEAEFTTVVAMLPREYTRPDVRGRAHLRGMSYEVFGDGYGVEIMRISETVKSHKAADAAMGRKWNSEQGCFCGACRTARAKTTPTREPRKGPGFVAEILKTASDAALWSEINRRRAGLRKSYTGGAVWAEHNPDTTRCRCADCNSARAARADKAATADRTESAKTRYKRQADWDDKIVAAIQAEVVLSSD